MHSATNYPPQSTPRTFSSANCVPDCVGVHETLLVLDGAAGDREQGGGEEDVYVLLDLDLEDANLMTQEGAGIQLSVKGALLFPRHQSGAQSSPTGPCAQAAIPLARNAHRPDVRTQPLCDG